MRLPEPLILSSKQTSDSQPAREPRKTYGAFIAITVAGVALTLFVSLAPLSVGAFWPFIAVNAQSAGEPPLLHDTTIAYLDAATNSDPNPSKGSADLEMTAGAALLANSGPDGTLPASTLGVGEASSVYEVREGDSLSEIADMYGISMNTILLANDIKDAKTIQPGDTLTILPVSGVQYKVKNGGTLSDVAKLYNVEVSDIAAVNGMQSDEVLVAGDVLIIPGGDVHVAATKKTAAKKSSTGSASASTKKVAVASGYYGNPLPGAYVSQGVHGNNGIDFAGMPTGSAVVAAAGGTVTIAESDGLYNGGYGNYVEIAHANGTKTRYAHLSSVAVSVGQTVDKGEKLGGVGNTGRSTGIHLHFEVRGAKNPFAN